MNNVGSSLQGALEAMLLVCSDPVPATSLAQVLEVTPGEVVEALCDLSAEYADANRGFQLREVAGGWRLFTHPAYHDQVEALVASWDMRKLSQAALETLAVVAYLQPVTREAVRAVRGVNSDGVLSSLVDKGLVREVGREKKRAGAVLYGTTRTFLERFGLKSVSELPPLEEFAPDEKTREFIRERLSGGTVAGSYEEVNNEVEEEHQLGLDALEGEAEVLVEAELETETDAEKDLEVEALVDGVLEEAFEAQVEAEAEGAGLEVELEVEVEATEGE
jgi:segregation and condensation protein B